MRSLNRSFCQNKLRIAPVLLFSLFLLCGCQTIQHIRNSSKAIEENRAAVQESTAGVRTNAQGIAESTRAISVNQEAIEVSSSVIQTNSAVIAKSTESIHENKAAIELSSAAIKTNQLVIEQSTRAISDNMAAIDFSSQAVNSNKMTIEASTAAISQNIQALTRVTGFFDEIKDNKVLLSVCILLLLTLLFGPSILTLIVLCEVKRLVNGHGRGIGSGKEPPRDEN